MKVILTSFLFIFFMSCNKPKTVLICGDHVCLNKAEARQFFEDNLSLEVKIIDRKEKTQLKLVQLNLKPEEDGKRKIFISKKDKLNNDLKTLTKKETKIRKKQIKERISKKIIEIDNSKEKKQIILTNTTVNKTYSEIVDVCTIIKKCNIEEISKYLIKEGKNKKFPNISKRE